jgi:rhomboid protease GluP
MLTMGRFSDDGGFHLEPERDDDIPMIGAAMLAPEVEFEDGMGWVPVVSLVLIFACALGYICEHRNGALAELNKPAPPAVKGQGKPPKPDPPQKLMKMGALGANEVLAGEWWRLVSVMFLHANFEHILGNALMLYVLGLGCEHAFGRMQFLGLFVLTGMAGAALGVSAGVPCSVGASGAVFGLAGALVGLFHRRRHELHLRDRRIGGVLMAYALYSFGLAFLNPVIDNWAHMGGFVSGLVMGLLLPPTLFGPKRSAEAWPSSIVLFALGAALLIVAGFQFVPRFVD